MRSTVLRNVRIMLITAAAGSVDAISYLGLGHVFTANMTGNTILLALALGGQVQGLSALRSGIALVGFLGGAVLGAFLVTLRIERRERLSPEEQKEEWPQEVNTALYLESTILFVFAIVWSSSSAFPTITYFLILLSSIAMGIQSVAISHLGIWGIVTTYITGTYTSFCVGAVRKISGKNVSSDEAIKQAGSSTGQELKPARTKNRRSLSLEAASLLVYGFGAVFGGLAVARYYSLSPWLPVIIVGIVAFLPFVYRSQG